MVQTAKERTHLLYSFDCLARRKIAESHICREILLRIAKTFRRESRLSSILRGLPRQLVDEK